MHDRLRSRQCARYLKALADPERLKIVECLQTGSRNVGELAALLGQEIANVSHHLGVLREAGLVCDTKQGKFVVYTLHPDIFQPKGKNQPADSLNLGCCRLELGGR